MKYRPAILVSGTVVAVVGLTTYLYSGSASTPFAANENHKANCSLTPGQTAAFELSSSVTAEGQSDSFKGVMSWQVEELNMGIARVRATFNSVSLSQNMTLAAERTALPEGLPFFLEIDSNCAISSKAFPAEWQPRARLLVATQLDNLTFLLPESGKTQWQMPALDGLGDYTAHFSLLGQAPLQIQRRKTDHLIRGAADRFGIHISLNKSVATATFDTAQPIWWQAVSGEEQMSVRTAGTPEVRMEQLFSLKRNDQLFTAVPQSSWALAEKSTPYDLLPELNELVTEHKSYQEAYQAFSSAITDKPPRYFDGALEMAAWLKQHPQDVDLLVAELRGQMDDEARPTAFLALELSGLTKAREALSTMLYDGSMSLGDQSRAASALADLGTPSLEVADLLLSRAEMKDMAGNASLLGVGSMLDRTEDPGLRQHIMQSLQDQLANTTDFSERLILIDSIGNTGEVAFVEVLSQELSSQSEATRRRAADALSRLPAEQAVPALLNALTLESDPQVSIALIDALKDTGASSSELVDVLEKHVSSPNSNQRAATIDLLGAQKNERTRQLLIAQYKVETDVQIKQRIGRYLPAKDLR
ncbi:MAG: HEAT repeat domain-containing protein [Gammaproteobacteria bacterium]|nr:HEAT repeat domain-containing protein [Gammaproteobacteria bacterium]MBU2056659.1 HEAT repeat domain-containing protein [Gammaproteobacteria bacterium]MBU2173996.1 HEAT repeat domain-containing protein [Gammaproteobacteria bacterium]MBU2247302.1 HEAT repeat domain-containing protein [Gammaproteobacteria bacterium]MBU2345006.1 HEAT repeat domain-containing protein [Gammaproteobacteria bacterium]